MFPIKDFGSSLDRLKVVLKKRNGRVIFWQYKILLRDVKEDLVKWEGPFFDTFDNMHQVNAFKFQIKPRIKKAEKK